MNRLTARAYYFFKPFIPRFVQVLLRRLFIQRIRAKYVTVWPIDERASKGPEAWPGWPEQKKFAFALMHDVDTEYGQSKCHHLYQLDETMGFRSSFNFVPERYAVSKELRRQLVARGFEVGVHGLKHDGKLFHSRNKWHHDAVRINQYLKEWNSVGFVSPSMHRKFDWMHELNVEYDASTFDTDPFEPQPDGMTTIYPFWIQGANGQGGYVELPYTLPQDFTLFIIMREQTIDIWKRKLDWIAGKGGMALVITHPDYMNFNKDRCGTEEYPVELYKELLEYIKGKYEGQYWHALPREIARFWKEKMVNQGLQAVRELEETHDKTI